MIAATACSDGEDEASTSTTVTSTSDDTSVTEATSTTQPEELIELKVGIGLLTDRNSVMAAAVGHRLEETGLFEEEAAKVGYDLEVEWKQFPYAPDLISDATGGGIQLGTIASFPLMIQLAQDADVTPVHVSFGNWEFMIVVRDDGSITDFDDLIGKTVGLSMGTTLEQYFMNFTEMELGGTPEELGIELVEQSIPVATLPPGVDAIVTFIPAWLGLEGRGDSAMLVNSFGITGPAYDGTLGTGAGLVVPSVQESAFYPEGYVALRHFFTAFNGFEKEHPELIEAWLRAYEATLRELNGWTPMEISELMDPTLWEDLPQDEYAELSIGRDLLYEYRDWIWPTAGEVSLLVNESKLLVEMGILEEALTEQDVLDAFEPVIPLLKEVYDELGYPSEDAFTQEGHDDVRGAAIWDL